MKKFVILFALSAMIVMTSAEDDKSNDRHRHGLFSHVNQWFSRLRNRGHHHHNNNNEEKKEEKKEEPTPKPPIPMMPGYPAAFPMGPGAPFMTPFGAAPGMMPSMYNPMAAMATQQFAHHVPAGPSARPPMMGAPPTGFGPMNPMMGSMGSPFSFSNSPMIPPMHHEFPDMHGAHHGGEGFSPFGGAGPYGSTSFAGETPEDPYGQSSHHSQHQGPNGSNDSMDSNNPVPAPHGEYDQYQKKK